MSDAGADARRVEAVRLIRMLAHARQVRIEARVQSSLGDLDLDAEDVLECLCSLTVGEIREEEPDETIPGKEVYVFRKRYQERLLYVKVSIRLPKDHDLKVLSFKSSK
ncbi:MAG: hypothetical protein Q8R92_20870 [Deltaproteobacteria bacterium]|nr:hypothetical protein [Deltaproteobacteria bacterium]